jgi:integration host factor subunit alpha
LSLGKKDIVKNIKSKAHLSIDDSKSLLEKFIQLIKNNKSTSTKISSFGSFYTHMTPARVGRNPKTKEEYIINSRKKLIFKPSNLIKKTLN